MYAGLAAIPVAFGLSLAGWVRGSYRAYGVAGTIISAVTGLSALGLVGVALVCS